MAIRPPPPFFFPSTRTRKGGEKRRERSQDEDIVVNLVPLELGVRKRGGGGWRSGRKGKGRKGKELSLILMLLFRGGKKVGERERGKKGRGCRFSRPLSPALRRVGPASKGKKKEFLLLLPPLPSLFILLRNRRRKKGEDKGKGGKKGAALYFPFFPRLKSFLKRKDLKREEKMFSLLAHSRGEE